MEDYNRIIESLQIRFVKAKNISILKPVTIENNYEVENYLFLILGGEMRYGRDRKLAKKGDILFVPGGKPTTICYGSGEQTILTKDDFLSNKYEYLTSKSTESSVSKEKCSYVAFEAKAFDSVNFFSSLDIPAFTIKGQAKISGLIKQINEESYGSLPGRDRIVNVLSESLTIELFRYILSNSLFVEKLATNSTYFKDDRLIDIFTFIKKNLAEDLSNKVLASVAHVSEDYVGQYFKMLTGINPQDYIEYQRMEAAVNLLRTSKKSIREIGKEVGYKDTAYFCRRFKMMFGIPAGKMRRRESLMSV